MLSVYAESMESHHFWIVIGVVLEGSIGLAEFCGPAKIGPIHVTHG